MANWRELIKDEMKDAGESFDDVVFSTLNEVGLDLEFDDGYGTSNGEHFTLWTKERVYFPVVYDGSEWCSSVPRNPCETKTEHLGGQ